MTASVLEVPNERLRAAIAASPFTMAELAEKIDVDPKTLERWVAGRMPHPNNRRRLADVLGLHPSDLWPEVEPVARLVPRDLADVQAVYPTRTAFMAALPLDRLFDGATSIRIAGLSNNLLCQHYADSRLEELLRTGTNVTCLFLDPSGPATAAREQEECYDHGHLANLTSLNLSLMQRLRRRLPEEVGQRLMLGTYEQTIRFNIIIVDRGSEQTAVVQTYLPHSRGLDSPTLVMQASSEPGLLQTYMAVYAELEAESVPC